MFKRFADILSFVLLLVLCAAAPAVAQTQAPAQQQPAAQPGTQPATQPVTQPATQPLTQPVTQPVTQPGTQPVTQPVTQPGTQPVTQPVIQPGTGQSVLAPVKPASGAYIREEKDKYEVFVFGDSLGAGVWAGLGRMTSGDARLKLNGRYKESSGFARPDRYDWNLAVEKILAAKQVDIAVVMLGANDRQDFRGADGRFKFASPEWVAAYSAILDRFIAQLQEKGVAVYWIGQPSMNEPSYDKAVQFISDLQKKRAKQAGVHFIDIRPAFVDEKDQFTWRGPDVDGVVRRMRAKDGVHFYKRGNNKIANLVLKKMNEDLANAGKAVPVAAAPLQEQPIDISKLDAATGAAGTTTSVPTANKGTPIFAIEEEMAALNIEPPQPGQPQQVARTTTGAPATAPVTAAQPSQTAQQATVDENISPAYEDLKARVRPGTPAGKVFIQGLVMTPQAGRADDFAWPRTQ